LLALRDKDCDLDLSQQRCEFLLLCSFHLRLLRTIGRAGLR
jgi:hypothetical protein